MAVSQNPNTYTDVEQVFRAAKEAGGGKYELPTRGDAVYWRRRAYTYRKLLGKISAAGTLTPSIPGPTRWDDVILTLEENAVVISFRSAVGVLRPLSGAGHIKLEPVPVERAPTIKLLDEQEDDALRAAKELAQEIGE